MKVAHTQASLRQALATTTQAVLVPTMGGLHDGHLALVRKARQHGRPVVVSIYVNPLQFGPQEDYATYPRRLQKDCDRLTGLADIVYAPTDEEMYPEPQSLTFSLPPLADEFCGASRPGFFHGVTLVVCKLFNQVRPAVALFGDKDYQQTVLIRLMTRQLSLPVRIETCPTVREKDGLAMSSRNEYLRPDERRQAPRLHATLRATADKIAAGETRWPALIEQARAALQEAGMRTDYFAIRCAKTLAPPQAGIPLVILAAAHLGKARLIDNIEIPAPS